MADAAPVPGTRWQRTAAFYRVPAVTVLAVGIGIATGRPDLIALAAPLVLGGLLVALARSSTTGWLGTVRRLDPAVGSADPAAERSSAPAAESRVVDGTFGASTATVRTQLTGLGSAELATVLLPDVEEGPIGLPVVITGGADMTVDASFRTRRWGPTVVARPDLLVIGPDGLHQAGPVVQGAIVTELVLPAVQAISPLPLPAITGGWAGAHLSRRPGQGSDLVDLREFAPGDRLRSIHWRAYARHQKLHTRRTLSDADAEMVICIDLAAVTAPHHEPRRSRRLTLLRRRLVQEWERSAIRRGDPVAIRRRAERDRWRLTSLDHTVAAATALAAAHLGQGDRVGLLVAAMPRRFVRPGTGNRQLQRIRHRLALIERRRSVLLAVQWWGLRPGQIVVICSTLTQASSVAAVLDCLARGHLVIVIDVLPVLGLLHEAAGADADHLRILLVERALQVERLRGAGVPVLRWEAGDLAVQMAATLRVFRSRR